MSSFDKVVKLACKPKAAPPKSKYLDPIISATWSDDGSVHDVCKALSPRFREPNAVVVFKALIVLHTMIRNGSTDNVLNYLSSSDVLRLRNVSAGSWDGYAAPRNLQHYAIYLDTRIRAYKDLKHDAIRVQAESNRDMRNSMSIEEDSMRHKKEQIKFANAAPKRSKTIMGRKLRSMTVEKGLLRETRIVQRMLDALLECRFYLDDLEDELTIMALRMLVKDLLILIQAGNEGVINVLEHYFEMSHIDAQQALEIYRHFCKQTEFIDEYLGVAKKLQNLLNIPIPNLKHAPLSLAGALQEYLDDPNFEQNRVEYRTNKEATEHNVKNPLPVKPQSAVANDSAQHKSPQPSTSSVATTSSNEATPSKATAKKDIDFFAPIEEEQSNTQPASSPLAAFGIGPSTANPFSQMVMGQPFQQATQTAAQTGFILPQQTAIPQQQNAFGLQAIQVQPTGHRPFASFLPQATGLQQQSGNLLQNQPQQPTSPPILQQQIQQSQQGAPFQTTSPPIQSMPFTHSQLRPQATGFLQPQATGANPFRQSMLFPQATGMAMFGVSPGSPTQTNPFNAFNDNTQLGAQPAFNTVSQSAGPISTFPNSLFTQSPSFGQANKISGLPARPASTPLTALSQATPRTISPPKAQPVQTHQTGSRNPFGPVVKTPPPVPKVPTLMELAMGANKGVSLPTDAATNQHQQQQSTTQAPAITGTSAFSFNSGALSAGATDMSGVASSLAFSKVNGANPLTQGITQSNPPRIGSPTTTTSPHFSSTQPGSVRMSPTVSSGPSSPTVLSPVKSHVTGFASLKPFKPTSSFGAALLESLPPIPDDAPTSSSNAVQSSTTSPAVSSTNTFGFSSPNTSLNTFNTQSTGSLRGSTLGQGLRPQLTGGGASNPFRASMLAGPIPPVPNLPSSATGSGFSSFSTPATSSTSASIGFGMSGGNLMTTFKNPYSQPQQQNSQSLI
ncbi:hypothetical protein AMATHDRAFT_58213 [Amanita thiersii Skay4041]|uniref:ENTH domain-containing protein n=1 Tax=Amanita thiersii Skay4041 TaxID=703135 RepID=A0A2A9NUL8_9AGAR|nr:hypothetical protein AMATHDRAFT_58213 [Amanita thiersii Skay4041]